jgi:branched-chain amino acid transport system substrate-binding protein
MKCKLAVALMLLIIVFTGCTGDKLTGEVVKDDVFRIGSVQAFTGKASWYAEQVKRGTDMALNDINSEGGINGKRLEILYEDSMFEQKRALSAVRKLFQDDGVSVIIGPTGSSNVMAVAPVANELQKIIFATVASTPRIKDAGDFVFRNSISGDVHGEYMAEYAYNVLGARTASTLYLNLANGVDYNDAFVMRFEELGGTVVVQESYEKGLNDFRTQLTKIKMSNPDVVYFAGLSVGVAVKQTREMGIDQKILAPVTVETQELLDIAGEAAEGILYTAPNFNPESSDENIVKFVADYKAMYNNTPTKLVADAYDAVMVMSLALELCGDDDAECIRDALYDLDKYEGLVGVTTFDEFGEVSKPLVIKIVEKEKFVFV